MVLEEKETHMKLFFETSQQIAVFVIMMPIGFVIGMLLDFTSLGGRTKPLWDILIMLLCVGSAGAAVVILKEEVRIYHCLALFTGAILYMCGIRCICVWLMRKCKKKAKKTGRNSLETVE